VSAVPKPNSKTTLILQNKHWIKIDEIALQVRRLSGGTVSLAGIVDHLLESANVDKLAAAIVAGRKS
jgi:hypothetical protein